jgi:hypothetical protein
MRDVRGPLSRRFFEGSQAERRLRGDGGETEIALRDYFWVKVTPDNGSRLILGAPLPLLPVAREGGECD